MILDIDFLIDFFTKHSNKGKMGEFLEQESTGTASTTSAPSGGGGKPPPKWADVHGGPQRGKANRLGASGEKWETGINRGVANQIW